MERERTEWNRRYRDGSHGSLTPDPFFALAFREFIAPRFPNRGLALDAAGGVGRHAIYLAEHGWRVRLVDVSDEGLEQARKNAGDLTSQIEFEAADLDILPLRREQFDLILVFFYLQREIFYKLIHALRPGGLLIYKTYLNNSSQNSRARTRRETAGGPSHSMHLLQVGELPRAFSMLRMLHYAESSGDRPVAGFVAEKPRA